MKQGKYNDFWGVERVFYWWAGGYFRPVRLRALGACFFRPLGTGRRRGRREVFRAGLFKPAMGRDESQEATTSWIRLDRAQWAEPSTSSAEKREFSSRDSTKVRSLVGWRQVGWQRATIRRARACP